MRTFFQRKYWLRDTVQPQFLAVNVFHQGLVFLTFAGSLFVPLILKLHNTPLSSPEAGDIATKFLVLHDSIWPAFPIALVLIVIHSVFFSHRIAGPLYRFRRVFRSISQGDLTVTTGIRKRDYLHQEAGSLGEMVGELRSKLTRIETDCRAVKDLVTELKHGLQADSMKAAKDVMVRLEQQTERLTAGVQQFHLHGDPTVSSQSKPHAKAA
jgi:methyl-accepting chemotaxis protein